MLQKTLGAAAIMAFSAAGVQAQETYTADGFGPEQGDWELILAGSGSNDNDFDSGSGNVNAELGYYFTEMLEGGVRQQVSFADSDDADSTANGSTGIFVDYHFDFGQWRPFIGATIGYLYGDNVDETFIAGPEAGVKWYIKDETFIYGRATYEFLFEDADEADAAFDDGRFSYVLGIGFNF